MIKNLPLLLILGIPVLANASTYTIRGHLSARAGHYTHSGNNEKSNQRHRAQVEQESRLTSNLIFINQLRWSYNSLYTDLKASPSGGSKDTHKIFPGDNYFKYKSASWVLQTGYQEVAWGEAFGFNYADIINPKDMKETFYSDYSESRLPLFLMNFKYFFTDGSLQLIYSPEPRFSESLPIDLFTRNILPQATIISTRQDTPAFFKEHEYGGKLSASFWGFDTSLFYFSYLDRDANYFLKSASADTVQLQEEHSRVKTAGFSLAKTLFDNYVFRTDMVYTKDKKINSLVGSNLISTPLNVSNLLVSLDTPTYHSFSGVLIFASSRLNQELSQAFREKSQTYSIAKISYDLGEEKVFDLSYTHEFSNSGHAIQSLFNWPVTDTLELKFGAETYWGEEASGFSKIKNISNIFFGIKNYFQL